MADLDSAPVFKKRASKATHLRKRPATPPPEPLASDDSDFTSDEEGHRIKRRKREGVNIALAGAKHAQDLSKFTSYQADRSDVIAVSEDATKASNWYTDAALAAQDEQSSKQTAAVNSNQTVGGDGTYKGTTKYASFIEKNPNAPTRQVGPVKAPTNIRTITVTDFAPDVCKDYKQTGYCGFGDSCKFLHAREDYKQGWQLDKEWESAGKRDKASGKASGTKQDDNDLDEEEKLLSSIPFKCIICKDNYKNPVLTKCGHYFCSKCAMTRYQKEKKKSCANCGKDTGGNFVGARKLNELLEKKKSREKERKERAKEAGEEVSDAEDD